MSEVAQADANHAPRGYVPWWCVAAVFILLTGFLYLPELIGRRIDAGIAYQSVAAVTLILVGVAIIAFCVRTHRRYTGRALLCWPGWRKFLVEAAIAAPLALMWALAEGFLVQRLAPDLKHANDALADAYRPVIILPVFYCLGGLTLWPVAEEMLCRGLLYGSLRRWMRPTLAGLLQALVFGLLHRRGLMYMSVAFLTGVLLMALYLWRRTL
jgi:membrane protease YdiL (CAAX protease family)